MEEMEQPIMTCIYSSEQLKEQMKLMEYIDYLGMKIQKMEDDVLLLECLRGAGVDNWDGWGDAISDYNYTKKDSE